MCVYLTSDTFDENLFFHPTKCNNGCHPVTLLEATSHEQIKLAKIVAEDKEASPCSISALSTLVKKRKVQCEKTSKRLAATIDNMLDVEHTYLPFDQEIS